jgi:hypothetical protein
MHNFALVTVFFEYPPEHLPRIYKRASEYMDTKDIYIARFSDSIPRDSSYYEKLYTYKIKKLLEYLKEHIIGKYEFMLFVDATDTNFYRNPNTLIDDFLKFNKSIVFNAEQELWPHTIWTDRYVNKNRTGVFPYLNSGVYVGYVSSIVQHLQKIVDNDYEGRLEDQSAWTIEYLLHDDIEIDSHGKLFFSSYKNKSFVSLDNNNNVTLSINPYVIHDNGPYTEDTIKITEFL